MLITIPNVLTKEEVARVRVDLKNGEFVDGRGTAAAMARDFKNNLEYKRPGNKLTELDQFIMNRLMTN